MIMKVNKGNQKVFKSKYGAYLVLNTLNQSTGPCLISELNLNLKKYTCDEKFVHTCVRKYVCHSLSGIKTFWQCITSFTCAKEVHQILETHTAMMPNKSAQ